MRGLRSPYGKDDNMLGSILGTPVYGNPHIDIVLQPVLKDPHVFGLWQ